MTRTRLKGLDRGAVILCAVLGSAAVALVVTLACVTGGMKHNTPGQPVRVQQVANTGPAATSHTPVRRLPARPAIASDSPAATSTSVAPRPSGGAAQPNDATPPADTPVPTPPEDVVTTNQPPSTDPGGVVRAPIPPQPSSPPRPQPTMCSFPNGQMNCTLPTPTGS